MCYIYYSSFLTYIFRFGRGGLLSLDTVGCTRVCLATEPRGGGGGCVALGRLGGVGAGLRPVGAAVFLRIICSGGHVGGWVCDAGAGVGWGLGGRPTLAYVARRKRV